MSEEFTAKFKVDISDLKKNIDEAKKAIKTANATFKAETSGMDNWSKNADGLSKKLESLKTVLANQKSILADYQSQLKKQQEAYDENGKRAEQLKAKLQDLAANGISKTDAEYKEYQNALKQVIKEQQNNEKSIEGLNAKILDQKGAIGQTESSINKYSDAQTKLAKESESFSHKVEQQEKTLEELKKEYVDVVASQGKSSDAAQELAREIDDLSGELKDNKSKLEEAEKAADDLDNSFEEVGDSAEKSSGGFTVLKGAIASLVADGIRLAIDAIKDFAKETINVGKEFDSSMSQVAAVSGATGDELQALRDKAKEMGSTTKFTASEAADAFNYMAMAGWKTEDMLGGIEGVLNLAAASGADLATTSDIVTDALTAMGYSAADAGRLADVMAAASSNANTNVEMMGSTFQYAAPIIGAMGYSMEDAAVAIGLMANAGIKGDKAGTALRSTLTRLAAPPKEAATAMEALGIEITNADGTMKPFSEVINILRGAFDGLSESQQTQYAKAIAGQEAMSGLLAIVNASPADFDKLTAAVNNSEGAAAKMAETMQDNLGGDLTKLGSQFEGIQLSLYEKFEPALRSGVEVLSKFGDGLKWLIDHSSEVIAVLAGMAAGVAAYLAYTTAITVMTQGWMALTVVQKAVTAAQWLMNAAMSANPIGLVIAAVAALVAGFVVLWKKSEAFREFWIGLWEGLKKAVSTVVDWIKENWKTMLLFLVNPLAGVFKYCYEHFEGFRNFVDKVIEAVKGFFSNAWETIKKTFSTIADWVNTNVFQPITRFFEPVITFFKEAWQIISTLAQGCWEIIKRVWEIVSEWFKSKVVEPVKKFFTELWNGIKDTASSAWEGIKKVWNVVSTWFKETIIDPVSKFFSKMWSNLKSAAKDAWEGIKSVFKPVTDWFKDKFTKAWTAVKNVFSTGGKIFDGIKEGITSAFKKVVNAIIRGINKVIAIPFNAINKVLDKIRNVEILGISPFSGLGSISVPKIPELAKGGVLKRGQVGLLEGDGAEAVVPLEKNKQWIKAVANDLLSELKGDLKKVTASSGNVTNSKVNNFTQNIYAPKQPSRIELYRQTRNLLDYAGEAGGI